MKIRSRKFAGVYIYKSSARKNDECYYIKYRAYGTQVNEKVGWKSEGYTQEQAATIRTDHIHAARHGKELPQKDKRIPTFSEAFEMYMDSRISVGKKRMHQIRCRFNRYLHSQFGNRRLVDVNPTAVRSFVKLLEDDGLHGSTIKHYLGIIGQVFTYMKENHDYKHPNPMDKVRYSAPTRNRMRYLTKDEASELLREMLVAGSDLYLQTALMLFTGMRINEAMNIRGRDINFETGQIKVIGKGRNGVPKERFCEMNEFIRDLLKIHPLESGEKLFKRKFRRVTWHNVVESLGLNKGVESSDRIWRVTPHTLRHTFGSWLGQAGVSPMIIQQAMGHEKIQTSMQYAKLGPRAGQSAVNGLTKGLDL